MNIDAGSHTGIDFFWEWYRRHHQSVRNPLAELALDKCEETFRHRNWHAFGYWFEIYRRERVKGADPSGRR